jgi:hypothetical protein
MLRYFGTSTESKGHYFWVCEGEILVTDRVDWGEFEREFFWPETLVPPYTRKQNGDVFYFRINGCTICYIVGSCIDERLGCKSVFFTQEKVTYGELALMIVSNPAALRIIKKMPFEVQWKLTPEIMDQIKSKMT